MIWRIVWQPVASPLMHLLLLNGPNLNLLGSRAPEVYGSTTLAEVEQMCRQWAGDLGHRLDAYQSNHEGALIEAIHDARGVFDGIVFNPGAYSHTSHALHDAIEAVEIPTVEIHISNVRAREAWRRTSRIEPACVYQIFGRGVDGYQAAIRRIHHLDASPPIVRGSGDHPDRVGDLRLPEGDGPHPVVVLLHGGFWREQYTRDSLDSLAVDLTARGVATWNVEYRRIPPIGAWRTTIGDAADAIDAVTDLAAEFPLDPSDITVLGHSAGAHLAVLGANGADVKPRRLVLLGGVLDLGVLDPEHDALPNLLGDELDTHRDIVDPISHVPRGIASLVVHGDDDVTVDPAHSANYVAASTARGEDAALIALRGSDHWDLIDARSDAWKTIAGHLF